MLTKLIESIKTCHAEFNNEDLTGQGGYEILRPLGFLFIIGFLLPYYDGRFYFEIITEVPYRLRSISPASYLFLFYLPFLYGIILLIAPYYAKKKVLDIILICMGALFLIAVTPSLYDTRLPFFEITGNNIFGTFWLFVLSNCLLFLGLLKTGNREGFAQPRNLFTAGALLFILNLFLESSVFLWDFNMTMTSDRMFLTFPFTLFKHGYFITAVIMTLYLIIILFVIARELYVLKRGETGKDDKSLRFFIIAWILLIPGMLIAGNIDVIISGSRFSSYPWRANVRECAYYIKSMLYILPLIAIIYFAATIVLNYIARRSPKA